MACRRGRLAEAAGDAAPDGMQDFLSRMRPDAAQARDDRQAHVVERLGHPDAVLVLDEAGFGGSRAASPTLLIPPGKSVAPDWHLLGVSPK